MKKKLADKRPLSPNTLKSIRENLLIEWTYNSNAIEGNTLISEYISLVKDGDIYFVLQKKMNVASGKMCTVGVIKE